MSSRQRPLRLALAIGAVVLTSCAVAPTTPPPPPPPVGAGTIMGPSELTADQIAAYVQHVEATTGNVWAATVDERTMAQLFIDEGSAENVRGDIAFCQSIWETGWFQFKGFSKPQDNNFAGIGAFTGSTVYMTEPTAQLGVRAQIQHLRNYADATSRAANLHLPLVLRPGYDAAAFDSFRYKGAAPNWTDLNGKWAVPGTNYGENILNTCSNMRAYSGLPRLTAADVGAATVEGSEGPIVSTARN
ncbi:MAG: glucosaminidase domain-containing protein [Acidimicrobiia bacterium]|jgi:hypothetical protein|nr:glucosaminidase domain-containing protein [Acidimicrobiia bacterium]